MTALSSAMSRLLQAPGAKKQRISANTEPAEGVKPIVQVERKVSEAIGDQVTKMADEHAVLSRLFGGFDLVILLLHGRRRALWSVVRENVEAATGRDLTQERLKHVLALAGDMFEVKWFGTGLEAELEFTQRVSGERRPPSCEEQWQRKEQFDQDLLAAVARGIVPQQDLPERPASAVAVLDDTLPVDSIKAAVLALPASKKPLEICTSARSVAERQHALLARIRAREAANNSTEAKVCDQVARQITLCDNAMALHAVVRSLFARGQGANSAASEAEVLRAACSTSFSAQAMRPMDKEAAQIALEHLILRSTNWFNLEHGVHVQGARYLKRQPKGEAAIVMARLQAERRKLEEQLRSLRQCSQEKHCVLQDRSVNVSPSQEEKLTDGLLKRIGDRTPETPKKRRQLALQLSEEKPTVAVISPQKTLAEAAAGKECGLQIGSVSASPSKEKPAVGVQVLGAQSPPKASAAVPAAPAHGSRHRAHSAPAAAHGKRQTTETPAASSSKKQRTRR